MRIPRGARYLSRRGFLARLSGAVAGVALLGPRGLTQEVPAWDEAMQFEVAFDLASQGYRLPNPYLAVWIEEPRGHPIRTLGLWADTRRGGQYLYHLVRWNRWPRFPDRTPDHPAQLDLTSLSRPTTVADRFTLVWDGLDDLGRPVAQGTYAVCVEAAREKSGYGLVRAEFTLDDEPIAQVLPGDGPIGEVEVRYQARS